MSTIEASAGTTLADRIAAITAKPVLRINEVTEVTGASRSTIVRAIASGELPSTKVGRNVYLPTGSTLAYFGADLDEKGES